MFKNIGKTIRILAIVLAALSFLGFAALGTLSLLASMEVGISDELEKAGLQAAIICYALAVITPFLNLILYGFGTLISTAQAQAEDSKKTREMLQTALADGMLSEEIARKCAQAQAKLLAQVAAQAPTAEKAAKKPSRAPMQRPVKEISETPATTPPVQEEPIQEEPVQDAPAFIPTKQIPQKEKTVAQSPIQAAPAFIPVTPATPAVTPAVPTETATLLQPLSADEETF